MGGCAETLVSVQPPISLTVADIAIVKVGGDLHDLPALEINREDRLQADDTVTIIGNPLGFEKISQRGSVGGFHRRADSSSPVFDVAVPINPGNSGSPVINGRAQAVGIVFASTNMEIDGRSVTRALAYPVQVLPE
jgi:S1-C subfamily serine protease